MRGFPGAGFPTVGQLDFRGHVDGDMHGLRGGDPFGRTDSAPKQIFHRCARAAARAQHGSAANTTETEGG
jgi:hypothetical protein